MPATCWASPDRPEAGAATRIGAARDGARRVRRAAAAARAAAARRSSSTMRALACAGAAQVTALLEDSAEAHSPLDAPNICSWRWVAKGHSLPAYSTPTRTGQVQCQLAHHDPFMNMPRTLPRPWRSQWIAMHARSRFRNSRVRLRPCCARASGGHMVNLAALLLNTALLRLQFGLRHGYEPSVRSDCEAESLI
jgi:hypothetical protein